jgi:hypothetical protein
MRTTRAVSPCTQYAVMVLLALGRCGWPQPIRWDLRSRVLRTQTRDRNHVPCLPASVWLRPIARQRSLMIRSSSICFWRIVSSSLTTSAVSRHTFSVQAAGAGSHKPKSGRRRPWHDRRVPSMSTLRAQSVSPHHDGVRHQTSLRSQWTMMTRANSLHVREAGRPINVAVTQRGPELTRAFPHGHRAYDCRASPRRQNSV